MLQLPTLSHRLPGPPPVRDLLRQAQRRLGWGGRPPRWERAFQTTAEASALEQQLRPLARRLRQQRTVEQAPRALLIGVGVALLVAALARWFDGPGLLWLGLGAAPLVTLVVLWLVARRAVGPFETARRTDASLLLRERLATALELLDGDAHGPIVDRQVADATAAVATLDARQAFPFFATGSRARRLGYRYAGLAAAGLAVVALLVLGPFGGVAITPADESQGKELALADPGSQQDSLVREPPRSGGDGSPDAVAGQTQRPSQVGDQNQGLVGTNPQDQQGSAGQQAGDGSPSSQQPKQAVQSQTSASVAQRQQALQDLGNALRNSQTAKQASDSLRRGDAQKASQQLSQVADQVQQLSPGERKSLSQAFAQAAQQIGDKDRALADAAKRASDALNQFQNQEAQQAIKDAANEVRDTGQQVDAQRQLEQRGQDLQKGNQPSLPQGQPNSQGQQGQQSQQGQQGQQSGLASAQQNGQSGPNGQTRSGGDSTSGSQSLSDLENQLRNSGTANGTGGNQGAGSGEGSDPLAGPPHRLSVDARVVQVDAQEGEGPTQWRPPNPNAPPAPAPPPVAAAAGAPASAAPVGAGPDLNNVPWDLAGSVQKYFTPDPSNAANASSAAGTTSSTGAGSAAK